MSVHSGSILRAYYFAIALVVVAADQLSKSLVKQRIPLNDSVDVIAHFFRISHVLNRGAAFSAFADERYRHTGQALIAFSVCVLCVLCYALWRATTRLTLGAVGLSMIMGGAIGNLTDRLRIGSVVDFLAFDIGSYHWPDFNLADSAIVVGSALLVLELLADSRRAAETTPYGAP